MNGINVAYRRFPGYGDIISPILYTHFISRYFNVPAHLNFFYQKKLSGDPAFFEEREMYEHPDSEDVRLRTDYIFNNTDKSNLTCDVSYSHEGLSEPYPKKHSMLEEVRWHNYGLAREDLRWVGGEEYVVFITTTNNQIPFDKYPNDSKMWKDPLHREEWEKLEKFYHKIKYIDYTTPIEEAVEILRKCRLVISYHGSAAWLARWLGCPQVIFSGNPKLTEWSFPNAIIRSKFDEQLCVTNYALHCQNVAIERTQYCMEQMERKINKGAA